MTTSNGPARPDRTGRPARRKPGISAAIAATRSKAATTACRHRMRVAQPTAAASPAKRTSLGDGGITPGSPDHRQHDQPVKSQGVQRNQGDQASASGLSADPATTAPARAAVSWVPTASLDVQRRAAAARAPFGQPGQIGVAQAARVASVVTPAPRAEAGTAPSKSLPRRGQHLHQRAAHPTRRRGADGQGPAADRRENRRTGSPAGQGAALAGRVLVPASAGRVTSDWATCGRLGAAGRGGSPASAPARPQPAPSRQRQRQRSARARLLDGGSGPPRNPSRRRRNPDRGRLRHLGLAGRGRTARPTGRAALQSMLRALSLLHRGGGLVCQKSSPGRRGADHARPASALPPSRFRQHQRRQTGQTAWPRRAARSPSGARRPASGRPAAAR